MRLPAHATALGKVLLGNGESSLRESFDRSVVAEGLERRTPSTITDGAKLFEQLAGVSVRGFAVDLEECEQGLHCVAAPVWDASGRPLAAISVSGPSFRLPEERLFGDVVDRVVGAANALSRELGYAA